MIQNEPKLVTATHLFRYEQLARDIDKLEDLNELKSLSKLFLKLYLSQQETLSLLGNKNGTTNE